MSTRKKEEVAVSGEDTEQVSEETRIDINVTGEEEEVPESSEEDSSGETPADPLEEATLRIAELETENSNLKNDYLRKQADFENFRKRMFREKEDAIKYANSNLLLDLVTIIDDFERAIKSSEDSRDFESFHSGIEMIEKQFTGY